MGRRFSPGRCCCGVCSYCCTAGRAADTYIAEFSGFGASAPDCTGCANINAAWVLPFESRASHATDDNLGGVCFWVLEELEEFMCLVPTWWEWQFWGQGGYTGSTPNDWPINYSIWRPHPTELPSLPWLAPYWTEHTTVRTLELRIRERSLPSGTFGTSSQLTSWRKIVQSRDCQESVTFTYADMDNSPGAENGRMGWLMVPDTGGTRPDDLPGDTDYFPDKRPGWLCKPQAATITITPA